MRPTTITAALLAGMLALAGCSTELPQPQPAAAPAAPTAVLTAARLDAVVARIGTEIVAADDSRNHKELAGVLSGPALTMRSAEYRLAGASDDDAALTLLPTALQSQITPTTQTWPRTAFAVTVQPENLEAPRLLVLDQANARANFTLWAWVRLFPGTELPLFPSSTKGTELVTNSVGLTAPMPDVVAAYADYLTLGKKSEHASEFESDELVENVTARRKSMTKALKPVKGKYSYTFTPVADDDAIVALRTSDGGVLLVAQLAATEKAKGPKGSTVPPDPEARKLLPKKTKIKNSWTVEHTVLVAIVVPPSDATGRPVVVGAENTKTATSIP